mgnify:CR=1 FL=1
MKPNTVSPQRRRGTEMASEVGSSQRETKKATDALTEKIIGAAIAVHRALGPGLLESVYEECMAIELTERGLAYERQKSLPVVYRGRNVDVDLRLDFIVAGEVVVELKAVAGLVDVHKAQLLTYLKLTGLRVGLLINFNTPVLRDGVKRLVLNYREDSASPRLGGETGPK